MVEHQKSGNGSGGGNPFSESITPEMFEEVRQALGPVREAVREAEGAIDLSPGDSK